MLNISSIPTTTLKIDFREKRTGIYKVLVPFYHEDGDMYDIFIEEACDPSYIRLSDYGLTLMKLSYSFEIDTENKKNVFRNIVTQNRCVYENGAIYLDCLVSQFSFAIYQFAQAIAKVMNMEILTRETIKSLFYDNLREYVTSSLQNYSICTDVRPLDDQTLVADYSISRPNSKNIIYLFGVNDNTKASKVIITCLKFQQAGLRHRSLAIHENFSTLTTFNQNQITNVIDKQFTSLNDFQNNNSSYIERELLA